MKKPQKHIYPSYPDLDYLDGLKHKCLSEKKLRPELIEQITNAIFKATEAECNRIRTTADSRLNTATAKLQELALRREEKNK